MPLFIQLPYLNLDRVENGVGLPNLLPFARNGTWSACFDFLDHSGNPKVIVIDLDNTENYEIFNNFDEWLKEAENDGW